MFLASIPKSLNELIVLLDQLSDSEYIQKIPQLSNSTIGEHIRHIIEMFQCLENSYDNGLVNYDKRSRNVLIQTNKEFAKKSIVDLQDTMCKSNKKIVIQQIVDGQDIRIDSNYHRELLYNFEHCVHHQALIKVGILQFENIEIDANFGVARSTIDYRNKYSK